jgi:hypothetical protein
MLGRVALAGAAALILAALLSPAPSAAARGAAVHHGGFHTGFHGHFRHGHFSHPNRNRYPYTYADLPTGDGYPYPQEIVLPIDHPIPTAPHCVHSVETVTVPSESGGVRKIRITRC